MATQTQISAGNYLRVIFKRKALIIGVFLIVALGIGLSIFRQPDIYEVSGKLLVTRSRGDLLVTPTAAVGGNFGFVLPQQQDLTAEVELLKSRALTKAVVRTMSQNRQARAPAEAPAEKASVMMADIFQFPVTLATWLTAWLPPWLGGPAGAQEAEPGAPTPLDWSAAGIQRALTIQVVPNSNVIEVRYRSDDRARAVNVVNTLLKLYLDRYLELRRPPGVTAFFTAQRDYYEQMLRTSEATLRQFEGRTSLINASSQLEVYSRQLAEAELTLVKTRYDILDKRQKLASTKVHLASLPERVMSQQVTRHNPLIDTLQVRLLDLETEREKLLQSYTEQDRRVRDTEERIAALRKRLGEQREWVPASEVYQAHPLRNNLQDSMLGTETSLTRLKIDEEEAQMRIDLLKQRIVDMAQQAVDRGELTREVRANEEAYLLYRKKVEETRISEAMDQQKIVNMTIAEEAVTPVAPLTKKNLSYAFALMVGLVGGVGSGFLREFFDDSVKTAADVTSSTALPVLASIPEEKPRGKKNGGHTEAP